MKKKLIYIILVIVIIAIVLLTIFIGDKKLDLNSEEVTELYEYLGEVDISHCGGLITYSSSTITLEELDNKNALCMAYYQIDNDKISEETIKSNAKTENNAPICKIDEGINLSADDNNECTYKIVAKEDINEAYKNLYGEDIKTEENFFITDYNACFIEDGEYYCGESVTFDYSLTPDATVYRLPNKALKKHNEDIVIEDIFLKVVTQDNTCYINNNNEKSSECTEDLNNGSTVDNAFIQKYGAKYRHTFKLDNSGNYYWFKTEYIGN